MWRDIRNTTSMVRSQQQTAARIARVAIQNSPLFNPNSCLVEAGPSDCKHLSEVWPAFRTVLTRSGHSLGKWKRLQRSHFLRRTRHHRHSMRTALDECSLNDVRDTIEPRPRQQPDRQSLAPQRLREPPSIGPPLNRDSPLVAVGTDNWGEGALRSREIVRGFYRLGTHSHNFFLVAEFFDRSFSRETVWDLEISK